MLLETRVLNISSGDLKDVTAANCLQFGLALDFACGDFARIYLRTGNEWSSLAALDPKSDYPHYFRAGRNTAAQLAAARAHAGGAAREVTATQQTLALQLIVDCY